jgi:DNA-binding HxlR family transcriptional regulator
MLGRTYDNQICSLARTLELVGERWTLLIVRDALLGLRRFDEFRESLGLARNVLAERLGRLVEGGVLERVPYQERPVRHEYQLTPAGRELGLTVLALMQWGDRHLAGPDGPPRLVKHAGCGGDVVVRTVCDSCGERVTGGAVDMLPGPARLAAQLN